MNNKDHIVSEVCGCAAICLTAVYLRSAYELSGGSALGILFGSVNSSVWERVKSFSIAYTGWSVLQLLWLRTPFRPYVAAKCAGLYLLMGGMTAFSLINAALFGSHSLWADILSSFALTAAAQAMSLKLSKDWKKAEDFFAPALMLLMLYYVMFFSFTVFPPRLDLFRDPLTGGFGVRGAVTSGDKIIQQNSLLF